MKVIRIVNFKEANFEANMKSKKQNPIFRLVENQHLYFLNVGFFLKAYKQINKQ